MSPWRKTLRNPSDQIARGSEIDRRYPRLARGDQLGYVCMEYWQANYDAIQYAWLRLMAGADTPVFVVGDDDQSIYGWRGARIENIHHFERDFVGTRVIKLEQNYRSTGTILKAANALIDNNHSRLGKELWTQSDDGEPIMFYSAYNEKDEARFVIDRIEHWVSQGRSRKEAAATAVCRAAS